MKFERTMKTLLVIVRNNKDLLQGCGLCHLIYNLYCDDTITHDEYGRLKVYLTQNIPAKGTYIFWRPGKWFGYWWKKGAWAPRKWWLNAQIRKLK